MVLTPNYLRLDNPEWVNSQTGEDPHASEKGKNAIAGSLVVCVFSRLCKLKFDFLFKNFNFLVL